MQSQCTYYFEINVPFQVGEGGIRLTIDIDISFIKKQPFSVRNCFFFRIYIPRPETISKFLFSHSAYDWLVRYFYNSFYNQLFSLPNKAVVIRFGHVVAGAKMKGLTLLEWGGREKCLNSLGRSKDTGVQVYDIREKLEDKKKGGIKKRVVRRVTDPIQVFSQLKFLLTLKPKNTYFF